MSLVVSNPKLTFNQRRELVVFGYIHEMEKTKLQSANAHIPTPIIELCASFFSWISDEWDNKCIGKCLQINVETISNICSSKSGVKTSYGSAYMKQIISFGHHEWKFKITKYHLGTWNQHRMSLMIGVWRVKENQHPTVNRWFTEEPNSGYGYNVAVGQCSDPQSGLCCGKAYGRRCNEGDTVTVILDLEKLTLAFKVNEYNYGKAFDIVPDKYRAAVFLSQDGDSVTLLEYIVL
eukprot:355765_1